MLYYFDGREYDLVIKLVKKVCMKKAFQLFLVCVAITLFSGPVEAKIVKIDFSQVPCCQVLQNQYQSVYKVRFDNNISDGYSTYQANGFITHLSTATSSAIPYGTTRTKYMFDKLASKVSFKIQSGSPFNLEQMRPAKPVKITYYGNRGNVLQTKLTDTCLKSATSCHPKTITYQVATKKIASVSAEILAPYSFSMDDLLVDMAN